MYICLKKQNQTYNCGGGGAAKRKIYIQGLFVLLIYCFVVKGGWRDGKKKGKGLLRVGSSGDLLSSGQLSNITNSYEGGAGCEDLLGHTGNIFST